MGFWPSLGLKRPPVSSFLASTASLHAFAMAYEANPLLLRGPISGQGTSWHGGDVEHSKRMLRRIRHLKLMSSCEQDPLTVATDRTNLALGKLLPVTDLQLDF